MSLKLLVLPLFLAGGLLIGCEDRTASRSPDPNTAAKAADAKAEAEKAAADAKAAVDKDAANASAAADKAAADAKAAADKAAINAKVDADKAAADGKADATVRDQASKLLADLQTAVTNQKWTDAGVVVKQLDAIRDRLAVDQKATFDSLKKQYDNNK